MAPPERDTSKTNNPDNLTTDLNNVSLAANQSVNSSSDADDDENNQEIHYRNGEVVYQQLDNNSTNLDADHPEEESLDDFQLLAESRLNKENERNKVRSVQIHLPSHGLSVQNICNVMRPVAANIFKWILNVYCHKLIVITGRGICNHHNIYSFLFVFSFLFLSFDLDQK